jgi:hypothetical protein
LRLKIFNMAIKKPGLILSIFLIVSVLAFSVTACNNDGSKDGGTGDSTAVKPAEPAPVDTTKKMDTASTRPVVPGN